MIVLRWSWMTAAEEVGFTLPDTKRGFLGQGGAFLGSPGLPPIDAGKRHSHFVILSAAKDLIADAGETAVESAMRSFATLRTTAERRWTP
jgi:hypothetical protein